MASFGEIDLITVLQLRPDLRNRPMTRKTALPNPGEDLPVNDPPRHRNAVLRFWAERTVVTLTICVRTTNQPAQQMHRTGKGMHTVMPMIAHNHPPTTKQDTPDPPQPTRSS